MAYRQKRRRTGPVVATRDLGRAWRIGPVIMTLDDALDFIVTEGFFWINA